MLLILITFFIYILLGAAVLSFVDEDGRLYKWYQSCPPEISLIAQPLVLILWPFVILKYFKNKKLRK